MGKQKVKFYTVLMFSISFVAYLTFLELPNDASAQGQQPPSRKEDQPASEPDYCKPPLIRGDCPSGQCQVGTGRDAKCQLANPAPGQLVGIEDFGQLLKKIIDIFLMFAGAIAVIFLMVGGFQYIASRGNEEATEKAKKTITNAIIGVVLIVMAFAIVNIVNTLLTKLPKEQAGTSKAPGPSGGPGATPAALNFTYFNPTQSAFCPLNGECEIGIGQVTGGTGPYDLAQTSGAPGGTTILISPGDGRLYLDGSPNEEGTFSISVTIRDKSSTPQSIIREFTLSVE